MGGDILCFLVVLHFYLSYTVGSINEEIFFLIAVFSFSSNLLNVGYLKLILILGHCFVLTVLLNQLLWGQFVLPFLVLVYY